MKLSIIIISWNTRDLTLKCVRSIFSCLKNTLDYEVFLVDNNSTDGTIEEIEKLKSGLKAGVTKDLVTPSFSWDNFYIIENKKNLGFTCANNQAIRQAKGEYVLLLNSDTELVDDSLNEMIEFAGKEKAGIIGPKLLNSDGSLQRSCRRFPKLIDQLFIQLKFYNFFPEKIRAIREYYMLDFVHDKVREVDQVMGAAMLVRKEVFNKIGLLDENFWAHFEEVDFCKRTKDAGYKIYFYPETEIMHHKEQSFKKMDNLKKQINFNHSLYYYFKKHKPFWQLFIIWLVQPINLFLTWIDSVVGVRRKVGKKKDL